jgi:predicted membrane protein
MSEERVGATLEKPYQRPGTHSSWGPTLAIIFVATLVYFAVNGSQPTAAERDNDGRDSNFSGTAFLSGIQHQNNSSAFRRADLSAFMGGVDLDLREATMEGDEARIEVSALMGGVSVRVPRNWRVVNRVTTLMGGFEDHTRQSDTNKRLVVEGTVLMGGLEIKN